MEQDFGGGTLGAEATAGRRRGSGRFTCMSMEGRRAHREVRVASLCGRKPKREGQFSDQGVRYGSGVERKREARAANPSGGVERAASGKPRGPTGDGEGRGGGGESNPTATLVDRVIPFYRKAKGDHEPYSA